MKTKNKNIKSIYLRYLFASFGSAIVMSIYSIVDAMCVGQYHHEVGTAALAVVMPLWTIIYSSGLLFGIGGSTIMMTERGKGDVKNGNKFFTVSMISALALSIILWLAIIFFQRPLLVVFGAKNKEVLDLAMKYTLGMKYSLPVFLSTQLLSSFVRSDNNPLLATIAVITGGVFNVFGDILFVFDFGLGLGIYGAGLATMIGQFITAGILCTHFFTKKNSLKFVKPTEFFYKLKKIFFVGIPSFILDIAMGIFTILFNNQIVNLYDGDSETATLAIYGVVCNIVALVQSLAYAVGQASQPLLSKSYGASDNGRIKKLFKYGIISCISITLIVFILLECLPLQILNIFIDIEPGSLILDLAPKLMRLYFIAFIFTITNVYFTYYFQSVLKAKRAFIISVLRGIVICSILLFILPLCFASTGIWITMPITEAIIFIMIMIWLLFDNKRKKYLINSLAKLPNGSL